MRKFRLSTQRSRQKIQAFDFTGGVRTYEKPASGFVAITEFAVRSEDEENLGP